MSVGRRPHPCFVGEEPTGYPVADGILDRHPSCATSGCLRREGFAEDLPEDVGDRIVVEHHDDQRSQDIGYSHEGHDELSD